MRMLFGAQTAKPDIGSKWFADPGSVSRASGESPKVLQQLNSDPVAGQKGSIIAHEGEPV
jgi:hypothetical protein